MELHGVSDHLNKTEVREIQKPEAQLSGSDALEITSEVSCSAEKNKTKTKKLKGVRQKFVRKKRKETPKHKHMIIDDEGNSLENTSMCNLKGESEQTQQQQQEQHQEKEGHGKSSRTRKRIQELIQDNQRLEKLSEHMEIVIECQQEMNNSLKTAAQFPQEQRLWEENSRKGKEIQRLQEEIGNKITEIQRLQKENNKKDGEIQRLQRENNNKDDEIQGLRRENNDQMITIERLREEKDNTIRGSVTVLDEELGRGSYGTVYTGDFYGTKVAVKEFHQIIVSEYYMGILKREINIASQCRHPNLLQFLCTAQNDHQNLLIVTELMDMSLRAFNEQRARARSRLTDKEVRSISLDVARGLNYLHCKKPSAIIHRDISSANVLLSVENNTVGKAKISDYGSANFMQLCNTANPGAVLYAAPEARCAQHDPKIDVYSYGILVCEMSVCEIPNPDGRQAQRGKILNAGIKQLVENCTKENPRERLTMQDVIGFLQELNKGS